MNYTQHERLAMLIKIEKAMATGLFPRGIPIKWGIMSCWRDGHLLIIDGRLYVDVRADESLPCGMETTHEVDCEGNFMDDNSTLNKIWEPTPASGIQLVGKPNNGYTNQA